MTRHPRTVRIVGASEDEGRPASTWLVAAYTLSVIVLLVALGMVFPMLVGGGR